MKHLLSVVLLCAGCLFAQETRLLDEWIEVFQQERIAFADDPEFRQIELGAAVACHKYQVNDPSRHKAYVSPVEEAAISAYNEFVETEGGALVEALLAGEPLPADKQKYEYIVLATALKPTVLRTARFAQTESVMVLMTRIINQGDELVKKGYETEGYFTREEAEALMRYRVWLGIQGTTHRMGITPAKFYLYNAQMGVGKPAADFEAMTLESVLNSPDYSDEIYDEYWQSRPLRPEGLKEFSLVYAGYDYDSGKVTARAYEPPERLAGAELFRTADHKGSPMLLAFLNATDLNAWHGRIAFPLQPLHRHFKDRVLFRLVSVDIGDVTMVGSDYFSDHKDVKLLHPHSPEEKAFETKMTLMDFPEISTPYVLDNPYRSIQNAYGGVGGGSGVAFLIDKNGKFLWPGRDVFAKEVSGFKPHDMGEFDNGRQFPVLHSTLFRALCCDALLARLLKENGDMSAITKEEILAMVSRPNLKRAFRSGDVINIMRERGVQGSFNPGDMFWAAATVTAINPETKTVTAVVLQGSEEEFHGLRFWNKAEAEGVRRVKRPAGILPIIEKWCSPDAADRTYSFAIDKHVLFFLNGADAEFSELKKGDKVGIGYYAFQDGSEKVYPEIIRIFR